MANGQYGQFDHFPGFEESAIDSAVFGKVLTDGNFRDALLQDGGSIADIKNVLTGAGFTASDAAAREIAELRDKGARASIEQLYMRPGHLPGSVAPPGGANDVAAFG